MSVAAVNASRTAVKAVSSAPPHSDVTVIEPSPAAGSPPPSPPSPPSPGLPPVPPSPAGHAVSTSMTIMNGATKRNLDIRFLHLFQWCAGTCCAPGSAIGTGGQPAAHLRDERSLPLRMYSY